MLDFEKRFLNACIKKHIKNRYTHEQLAQGITDKYMISRLLHGYTTKDSIYERLLARLDFYFENKTEIIHCEALYSSLLLNIETNNVSNISQIINTLINIIAKYPHHIYFEELNEYVSILKTHYIDQKNMDITTMDFSTLAFFPYTFRISLIHTVCENLLFYTQFLQMQSFFNSLKEESEHFLLSYWQLIIHQANKKMIEAHILYRNHIYHFLENQDLFNAIRFHLVYIQGDIRKHPTQVLQSLKTLESKFASLEKHSSYEVFIPFVYAVIYIRANEYEKAYSHIIQGLNNYPFARNIFLPYYIVLSIYLHKEIDESKRSDENPLNMQCMNLYELYKKDAKKEMIKYIIRFFPKKCCENPYFETMISILQQVVLTLSKQTRCYKSVIHFFNEYQKYNRNYYI